MTFLVASLNRDLNALWLDREKICAVINANSSDAFELTDSATGETTKFTLPDLPEKVSDLLQTLGY